MSNLVDFAENELAIVGMGKDSEGINKLMHDQIMKIVKTFSKQGHSGFSANYTISLLIKLLNYGALTPLTGEDDEWTEIGESMGEVKDMKWQNNRCFSVFKREDGTAYDSNAKVFYPKGNRKDTYTNLNSQVDITFPYTHKIEYVEVDET